MFYSQTFLSRKGPMGTVWCAAHLQHRLKKSHYTATNIPKTVDLIMFPEVPLALRMSGHLLLGVVRIYSKKVDYLYRDCNLLSTWLAKAFLYTELDLPEDARQAPVESVTLPQALNLDDFNLEYDTLERGFDNHLRSEEEITLADQIPTGVDPYVAVTFDEDIIPETEPMDVDQSTVPVSVHPGETDVEMAFEADPNSNVAQDGLNNDTEEIPDFQDSRPSNLTEVLNPETSNVDSPGTVPEIERMRDATHELSTPLHPPSAPEKETVRVEPTEYLDETLNEKETTTPRLDEEMLDSTFELRSGSQNFAFLEEEPANFAHSSPQLVLQPSPPQPQQQQRQLRPRKRKLFDRVTVLTNRFMRERIEDPSGTRHTRKKMPSSKLGIWRLNNTSRKDQMFNEPLLTGFSDDLRSVFEKDCIASKPYLSVPDETFQEPELSPAREAETETNLMSSAVQSPIPGSARVLTPQRLATDADVDRTVELSPSQQTEDIQDLGVPQSTIPRSEASVTESNADDMETERLRDGGIPEFMESPPPTSSPFRSDDFTPQPRTSETGTSAMFSSSYRTEPSTSTTIPEDPHGVLNSGLYDIPEIDEELSFLEISGDTPVRSPASQDSEGLTGRTRALANYLKERCSSSPMASRGSSEDLTLNKLLAGKTRKLAARMFFETLVLKSRNLVDVQQDEPYGDIALKLMPAIFSKAQ